MKLQCKKHIWNIHLEKLNWLPINQRFKQGVMNTVFEFVQNKCSSYLNEIFRPTENIRTNTRNSCLKPYFSKTSTGRSSLSYIGHAEFQKLWRKPKTWILSNIIQNTTIWMISLWSIVEFDYALAIIKTIFFSLNKWFFIFFSCFTLIKVLQWKKRLFPCSVLFLLHCLFSH